jgi:DNA-binding NtrC family response regulator
MALLLLVEDEPLLRWALRMRLFKAGHVVHEAENLAQAEEHLQKHRPEVVLLDVNLPDGNGIDFLAAQQEKLAESAVLVFTAEGSIADAVRAMKLGAMDFLTKPVNQDELLQLVEKATRSRRDRLEAESSRIAREKLSRSNIVAESSAMKEVLSLASTVAASPATVLVQGETGVGKEVVARFIHANSPRASAAFQALNCAALPDNLVESELFGYEKGAFTDAKNARRGLFELADGGTVVLDEIGEIAAPVQAKLLRVLEERTIRRLGGVREIPVDVRVIALTNRSLQERVAAGLFREDLYYRLNVFPLTVPPLRERREDIVPMALEFAKSFAAAAGKKITDLTPELKDRLTAHSWSGNVRELRNVIERACILEPPGVLTGSSISFGDVAANGSENLQNAESDAIVPLEELELLMLKRALRVAGGNQSQAARLLQVSRDQLRYRVKRYRDEGRLSGEFAE